MHSAFAADALRLSVIYKSCRAPLGTKHQWNPAIATKLCSSSAADKKPRQSEDHFLLVHNLLVQNKRWLLLCRKFLIASACPLDTPKQVSHLGLFRLQISARDFRDAWLARNTFDNVN